MRPFKFADRLLSQLSERRFSLALFTIVAELPDWLFSYKKAWLFCFSEGWTKEKESSRFGASENPLAKVKVAKASDADDISRICGFGRDTILRLLNSGTVCFLGSIGDASRWDTPL
jgi:hypothetical protein